MRDEFKPLRVYIAGRITGLDPLTVEENFSRARRFVEGFGHEALDPTQMVRQFRSHDAAVIKDGRPFIETVIEREPRQWSECMVDCIQIVMEQAEAIYFMANWRQSRGARIEHFIAGELGLKIWYECDMAGMEKG